MPIPLSNTGTSRATTVPAVTGMLGAGVCAVACGPLPPKLCHQTTNATATTRMKATAPIPRLTMPMDSLEY